MFFTRRKGIKTSYEVVEEEAETMARTFKALKGRKLSVWPNESCYLVLGFQLSSGSLYWSPDLNQSMKMDEFQEMEARPRGERSTRAAVYVDDDAISRLLTFRTISKHFSAQPP